MPVTMLDDMTNTAAWQAFAPDGVSPSSEISLTKDTTRVPTNRDASSGRISATTKALNHTLRRTLGPVDLTNFDEIRFWINSDRTADSTPGRRFYLEIRLASAALLLRDPNNSWQRYLPVAQAGTWDCVRVSLGDLPAAVRGSLNTIQFRCSDASAAFNCNLDDMIAVRDAMIGDVDAALQGQLNNVLMVGGTPIPAILHPANAPQAQARPYIEILQYDALFSRARTESAQTRGDYNDQGYSVRPPSNAFELFYQFTAVANDRPTQTAMLEFILKALPARGQLAVSGYLLPMESIYVCPRNQLGGSRTDQIPLFYKISTRQEVGVASRVQPARTVIVNADYLSQS
jgi:hypothetical protein